VTRPTKSTIDCFAGPSFHDFSAPAPLDDAQPAASNPDKSRIERAFMVGRVSAGAER
jgi:hypothetical protein